MEQLWYYRQSGNLIGPIPFSVLQGRAASGELKPEDEVRSGHGNWQKASTLRDLADHFREGGSLKTDRSDSSSLFADLLENAPGYEPEAADESESPSLEDDSHKERLFFCRMTTGEEGPLTLDEMQQRVAAGHIKKTDRYREQDSLSWIPCSELLELDFSMVASPPTTSEVSAKIDESEETSFPDSDTDLDPLFDDDDHADDEPHPQSESIDSPSIQKASSPSPSLVAPSPPSAQTATATVAPPPSKPNKQKGSSAGFQNPFRGMNVNFRVLGGLAVCVAAFAAAIVLFPSGNSGVHGKITIDGQPVPVGSVSITPQAGTEAKPLSIPIIEGAFSAKHADSLPEGKYDLAIIVGNPLGMDEPKMKDSPLSRLNGARYKTAIDTTSLEGGVIELELSSSQAILPKGKETGNAKN
ncbi:MAG: hypothetical protein Tsb009_09260 [Planctomycetaceae bacterium]